MRSTTRPSVSILLAIYLGLSPVYWLPGVSVAGLRLAKMGILIAAAALIGLSVLYRQRFRGLPSGFLGPAGLFLLFVSSVPGFLQASPGDAVPTATDYVICYLALWTAYAARSAEVDMPRTFALGGTIIVVLALLTTSSSLIAWPGWNAPTEFNQNSLSVAGFGARRTGWSNGLALFIPAIFMTGMPRIASSPKSLVIAAVGTMSIVASQLTVGGRAGLLASLFGLAAVLLIYRPAGKGALASLVALLGLLVLLGELWPIDQLNSSKLGELETHLRLDRLESTDDSRWDRFSAGRLGALEYGFEKAMQRPFTGYGFGNAVYQGAEIHNLWLKLWLESGIFLPLVLFTGVLWSARAVLRNRNPPGTPQHLRLLAPSEPALVRNASDKLLVTILLQGLIISMFEPNALVGSFQATAIWWFSAGALAERRSWRRLAEF